MKLRTVLAAAALALFSATSCVPSLYPLYTEDDLVSDSRLPGTWVEAGDEREVWTLRPFEDGYQLAIADEDSRWLYEARLLNLDGHLFLDVLPVQSESATAEDQALLKRLHVFLLVRIEEDRLKISAPDLEEFQRHLAEGTIRAQVLEMDGGPVLAEPTAGLQRLVVQLAATPGAFTEPVVFVRR